MAYYTYKTVRGLIPDEFRQQFELQWKDDTGKEFEESEEFKSARDATFKELADKFGGTMIGNPYGMLADLIYDVSLQGFRPGRSDFTIENYLGALHYVKIIPRTGLDILTDVRVLDKLIMNNMLEHADDNSWRYGPLFKVSVDEKVSYSDDKCYSLITSPCGKKVCLITREFQ